jgi:hypothetical protein
MALANNLFIDKKIDHRQIDDGMKAHPSSHKPMAKLISTW